MPVMTVRCDWCGQTRAEMPVYPIETERGWLTDPFHKRDAQFYACSETCKTNSEDYYARYRQNVRTWVIGFAIIFGLGFLAGTFLGYPVFRWAMPAAIGLGGLWMIQYPYANSFRRDASGSLKTSLKRSLRDGRILGSMFVIISLLMVYVGLHFLPDLFPP